jgi:hypothetical protein
MTPEKICEERFLRYDPDECSGYRRLDIAKLFNMILYFCKDGDFKTRINKLLFYADFLHYKQYTVSITGARYAHAIFGPVPDRYATLLAVLIENGSLAPEEFMCSDEITRREACGGKEYRFQPLFRERNQGPRHRPRAFQGVFFAKNNGVLPQRGGIQGDRARTIHLVQVRGEDGGIALPRAQICLIFDVKGVESDKGIAVRSGTTIRHYKQGKGNGS